MLSLETSHHDVGRAFTTVARCGGRQRVDETGGWAEQLGEHRLAQRAPCSEWVPLPCTMSTQRRPVRLAAARKLAQASDAALDGLAVEIERLIDM